MTPEGAGISNFAPLRQTPEVIIAIFDSIPPLVLASRVVEIGGLSLTFRTTSTTSSTGSAARDSGPHFELPLIRQTCRIANDLQLLFLCCWPKIPSASDFGDRHLGLAAA